MKIAIASDIHLEFGDIELKNMTKADVLVLAGDICVASHIKTSEPMSARYGEFFRSVAEEFPVVLYIMGNHEHYDSDFNKTISTIKKVTKEYDNFHILDSAGMTIGDFMFVGGTLWTDMGRGNPIVEHIVSTSMNDFVYISNHNSAFSVHDAQREHAKTLMAFGEMIRETDKEVVVISHHAPSFASVADQFKDVVYKNSGYASDLSDWILDRPSIKLWIHGHMHLPVDYMIGNTRVFSNPRGYHEYEESAGNFVLKTIEI